MKVSELREALKNMPGEMSVYNVSGTGIDSVQHTFRCNLLLDEVEQFCELKTYFEDHTPQMEDILIERETGFKNRRQLLDAYKLLKEQNDARNNN